MAVPFQAWSDNRPILARIDLGSKIPRYGNHPDKHGTYYAKATIAILIAHIITRAAPTSIAPSSYPHRWSLRFP
jgi:hypothetical protein